MLSFKKKSFLFAVLHGEVVDAPMARIRSFLAVNGPFLVEGACTTWPAFQKDMQFFKSFFQENSAIFSDAEMYSQEFFDLEEFVTDISAKPFAVTL
eukprot:m.135885 g.135885  ORF g.135885 m.135885 type:complete len:96 (+) comp20176_c0_seq9:630-917(+)